MYESIKKYIPSTSLCKATIPPTALEVHGENQPLSKFSTSSIHGHIKTTSARAYHSSALTRVLTQRKAAMDNRCGFQCCRAATFHQHPNNYLLSLRFPFGYIEGADSRGACWVDRRAVRNDQTHTLLIESRHVCLHLIKACRSTAHFKKNFNTEETKMWIFF